MRRSTRIIFVTAGLSVAGALLGAIAASLALIVIVASTVAAPRLGSTMTPDMLLVAAGDGAAFGFLLGPLTAWLALRRVPLGWAMLVSTAGTTVGTIAGAALPFAGAVPGAVAGFLMASLWLRRRVAHPAQAQVSRVA